MRRWSIYSSRLCGRQSTALGDPVPSREAGPSAQCDRGVLALCRFSKHGHRFALCAHVYMGSFLKSAWGVMLTRISHKISTAAAQTCMSTALRSVGLLDVLSSTSAGPSVALAEMRQMRLASTPVCAASLRNLVRNAG